MRQGGKREGNKYNGAYQNQQKRWGKLFLPAGKVWFTRG